MDFQHNFKTLILYVVCRDANFILAICNVLDCNPGSVNSATCHHITAYSRSPMQHVVNNTTLGHNIFRMSKKCLGPQMGITFSVFSFLQPVMLNLFFECDGHCTHPRANAHKPEHLLFASSLAAAVAGFTAKFITYPLDLAKKRLQIASHQTSDKFYTPSTSKNLVKCTKLIECIRETWKAEGVRGLYRGVEITLYKAQLTNMVAFTTYELVCYFIRGLEKQK